jgi:hypothetical protein
MRNDPDNQFKSQLLKTVRCERAVSPWLMSEVFKYLAEYNIRFTWMLYYASDS